MQHNANIQESLYIPLDDYVNFYYTNDVDLASALVCQHFELVSIDKINDRKVTFIFKNQKGITEAIDDFWTNRMAVQPLAFANARKNLKSRIFAMR